jgi:hypothetical protein
MKDGVSARRLSGQGRDDERGLLFEHGRRRHFAGMGPQRHALESRQQMEV